MVEADYNNEAGEGGDGNQDTTVAEPNVYQEQNNSELTNEFESAFKVRDPEDFHGHIVYHVTGADLQGSWECKRRYNEFYLLQDALAKRWPGIVIPQVPPKKAMGNKDKVFLAERRFYLERFMRKLSRYDFIINSQEFQIFCRP